MIFLDNITTAQSVDIPRTGVNGSGTATFRLRCSLDHSQVLAQDSITLPTTSLYYYTISVTLPSDLGAGDYEYSLEQGGVVISCGIARVGEYTSVHTDANSELTFKQAR